MYFTKIIIKKTLYTPLEGCRVHDKRKKTELYTLWEGERREKLSIDADNSLCPQKSSDVSPFEFQAQNW